MRTLMTFVQSFLSRRKMVLDLAKADFKKRFVGSYFGVIWMFVQPLVTVVIYAVIFGPWGFGSRTSIPGVPYVAFLVSGIVPWFYYSESLNAITNCLHEYSYLVKKVVFPVELLPVIKLISCFFVHLCFICIMLVTMLCFKRMPMITWIQIFYYTFALSVLTLGIGFLTAAIDVFFKDMAQIVQILLQFGMWMTPIMYEESMFTARMPWIETFFKINPMYYIVTGYRDSMLLGNTFWMRPTLSIYFWVVTLVIFYIGLKLFTRLRPHLSDVL